MRTRASSGTRLRYSSSQALTCVWASSISAGSSSTNCAVSSTAIGTITRPAPVSAAASTRYTKSTAKPRRTTLCWCERTGNNPATRSTTGVSTYANSAPTENGNSAQRACHASQTTPSSIVSHSATRHRVAVTGAHHCRAR